MFEKSCYALIVLLELLGLVVLLELSGIINFLCLSGLLVRLSALGLSALPPPTSSQKCGLSELPVPASSLAEIDWMKAPGDCAGRHRTPETKLHYCCSGYIGCKQY